MNIRHHCNIKVGLFRYIVNTENADYFNFEAMQRNISCNFNYD